MIEELEAPVLLRSGRTLPSASTTTTTTVSDTEANFSGLVTNTPVHAHSVETYTGLADLLRFYEVFIFGETILNGLDREPTAVASRYLFAPKNWMTSEHITQDAGVVRIAGPFFAPQAFSRGCRHRYHLQGVMLRNEITIDSMLRDAGFVQEDSYTDKFEGLVTDYRRGNDRITLVVTDTTTQVLCLINEKFNESLLKTSGGEQSDLKNYIKKILNL